MKIAVRYFTRSGNTKKLADAIAEATGVQAEDVSSSLAEKVDLLFLGSSYYGFDVDDAVKSFISGNGKNIGKIVCFGTAAMMGSTRKPVCKAAEACGVAVAEEEFHCKGSFGPMHKGRPNAEDLKKAAEFAKKLVL